MKKLNQNIYILLVCISGAILPLRSYGALSGNYTINPTKAASNSNYQNWASAVGDLLSGSRTDGGNAQGSGVSGPVTITVYDTIYANTRVELTAISGSSYSNTVTFKSGKGDNTKCLLRFASSSSSTDDYVLLLNGVDYVTFQNIGFERTGSLTSVYNSVVQITNDADGNKLIGCFMKGIRQPSNSTLGFAYGIGSCIYFTGNGDSTQITNCRLLHGYNGVYNVTGCTGNTFTGNSCDTNGSSGFYMTSQTSLRVIGNTLNMGDFGANTGHYTSYGMRIEISPSLVIAKNKVYMTAVNGQVVRGIIIASCTSTSGSPAQLYNNWIVNSGGNTSCSGFAVYACTYLNFMFNNVLVTNTSLADGAAYYHYPQYTNTSIKLLSNNFINKGSGYAVSVSGTNTTDFDSVDFNNIYTTGSNYVQWGGTSNISSLSGLQSASGKDVHSLNLDPGFVSNINLHVSSIGVNAKAFVDGRVPTDIDGETRDVSTPDIGADEFFPVNNDAGVSSLDSPIYFCAGKRNIRVKFQNYGIDTIKSVQIHWQINGNTPTVYSWTGVLPPGSSSSSINIGSFTYLTNTAYNFRVWTRNPNSASDGKNNNDTLKITRLAAMSGVYTLGDTSTSNYKSFNESVAAISGRGLCGAVIFKVRPGTYNEQITYLQLPGMGSSNPVIYENTSNDSTKVIITLPSTTATGVNNATLQLRGADYVTFKGITFQRTGTNAYAQVIHIINGSTHNTFTNCQMFGLSLTASNPNAVNIWSDQTKDDDNTFRNSYIKYGQYNILYAGTSALVHETGTVIENNVFEGAFLNSLQLAYNDKAIVRGNTFLNVYAATTGNYDIFLRRCDSNINVNGNFFKSTNTTSSLLLNGCYASSTNPGTIANNSIVKSSFNGIVLDTAANMNIAFNSIYFSGTTGTGMGIYTTGYSSGLAMQNNNIVMQTGEVYHVTFGSEVSISDHNNLFTKGGAYAYWGTPSNNLADLTLVSGKESGSLSVNPYFTSSTDLHVKNPLLKGAGVPVKGVSTDIDRQPRNATTPDIGADEFKLTTNDAGITEMVGPVAGTCAGNLPIQVVIRNFGNDTLKNATINWTVGITPQTPYSWTGKLPTGKSDTVVIGSFNFVLSLNPKFTLSTNQPNGNTDGLTVNDTIILNRSMRALPPANAGPDKTVCNGDTLNIGPNPVVGLSYKWFDLSGNLLGSNSKLNIKPTVQAKYILEVTNVAFGCKRRDTTEIGIGSVTIANAGSDKTICPGSSAQLGAASTSGFTYDWTSFPVGFTSSIADPTVNPSQTTVYYLKKTAGSGCKGMDTVVVTMAPVPNASISGKATSCVNELQTYNTPGGAGNSYNWNITGGFVISGQNTNSVNIRWNASGPGAIQLIESNTATCKDTSSYGVAVSPNPVAKFSANTACLGGATNFKDSSGTVQSYQWDFGDGGISTIKDPSHTYSIAKSYNTSLIVKDAIGCIDTFTKQVSINPFPVPDFTYVRQPNRTYDFNDISTISGGSIVSWKWHFGDGDSSSVKKPSHHFLVGDFTIKLCVTSDAGCLNCITQNLHVVGLNELVSEKNVFVIPNPGSGLFTITSSEQMLEIVVCNAMGQVIETVTPLNNEMKLDLTSQAAGIYFIRVNIDGQSRILKLVKQ